MKTNCHLFRAILLQVSCFFVLAAMSTPLLAESLTVTIHNQLDSPLQISRVRSNLVSISPDLSGNNLVIPQKDAFSFTVKKIQYDYDSTATISLQLDDLQQGLQLCQLTLNENWLRVSNEEDESYSPAYNAMMFSYKSSYACSVSRQGNHIDATVMNGSHMNKAVPLTIKNDTNRTMRVTSSQDWITSDISASGLVLKPHTTARVAVSANNRIQSDFITVPLAKDEYGNPPDDRYYSIFHFEKLNASNNYEYSGESSYSLSSATNKIVDDGCDGGHDLIGIGTSHLEMVDGVATLILSSRDYYHSNLSAKRAPTHRRGHGKIS